MEIEMNPVELMVDLETMDTSPTAAIVAIGVVAFSNGKVIDEFYSPVTLESSIELGLTVSASTVMWWIEQGGTARKEITTATSHLSTVLVSLTEWINQYRKDLKGVWGNGAAFDNVILANAYKQAGQEAPWPYYLDRCFRTIKHDLPEVGAFEPSVKCVPHHALGDARWQAEYLIKARR